jgi:hypothetical protein
MLQSINIINDIQEEIEYFFNDLNWTYIMMYVFVLYGIKHKEEFQWFNKLIEKYKVYSVWIVGGIIGVFFITFKTLAGEMTSEYISTLLRSGVITVIFNSVFSKGVSKIDKNE